MRKFLTVSLILLLLSFRIAEIAFAAETASAEIQVVIDGGGTAYMTPQDNSPPPTKNPIRVDNGRTGLFHIDFTEAGVYTYTISADFTGTTEYSYSVKSSSSGVGGKQLEDESFRLTVSVYEREDGSLYTVSVINNSLTTEKVDRVRFRKTQETTTQPTETTTRPTETTTRPTETTTRPTETTTQPTETTTWPTETTTRPTEYTTRPTEYTTRPTEYTTRPFETTTRPTETTTTRPNPKTGDESHLLRYVMIAVASSAGLFCLALLYTLNTNRLIKEE
ncbi:MAG: hypothetical protein K6G90_00050 [Clostridia bacterium]|nr:hypothetical protein [Clostridia bacterium]